MNADDGTFSRADFIFDPVQNQFTCPAGKPLMQVSSQLHGPRSDKCQRRKPGNIGPANETANVVNSSPATVQNRGARRSSLSSVHEDARNHARQMADTPEFERSRNERKKVEMLFAHLKTTLRFEHVRLRGQSGASDESSWPPS